MTAAKTSLALLALTAASHTLYTFWRKEELASIRKDALTLLRDGILTLPSPVTPSTKKAAWSSTLKPHMVTHWQTQSPGCSPTDPTSWPQPLNGKTHSLSSHNCTLPNLPLLISDNPRVQCILAYLLDPTMESVHFGNQTHFLLRLLLHPLALLIPLDLLFRFKFTRPRYPPTKLRGHDQSWHLVNLPNSNGTPGTPIPLATHIDSGERGVYQGQGLLLHQSVPSSTEERLLLSLLHQLAILFHCETPGDLGKEEGVTAFYPHSHLALLKGVRDLAACTSSPTPLPWSAHATAIRAWGEGVDAQGWRQQSPMASTQCVLVMGWLAHTTMWAETTMEGGEIRVIQNCKVSSSCEEGEGGGVTSSTPFIHPQSLLRVLARGNKEEWRHVLGLSEGEIRTVDEMAGKYVGLYKEALGSSGEAK